MPNSKEKQQIAILSVALAAIAAVLLWMYGDHLLPIPEMAAPSEGVVQLDLPANFDDPLFQRKDYQSLRGAQGVPVKPFGEIPRNPDPFKDTAL